MERIQVNEDPLCPLLDCLHSRSVSVTVLWSSTDLPPFSLKTETLSPLNFWCPPLASFFFFFSIFLGWLAEELPGRERPFISLSKEMGDHHHSVISSRFLPGAMPCRVLMLAKGTAIQKSFLAPLFTLQAPASVLSWIRWACCQSRIKFPIIGIYY